MTAGQCLTVQGFHVVEDHHTGPGLGLNIAAEIVGADTGHAIGLEIDDRLQPVILDLADIVVDDGVVAHHDVLAVINIDRPEGRAEDEVVRHLAAQHLAGTVVIAEKALDQAFELTDRILAGVDGAIDMVAVDENIGGESIDRGAILETVGMLVGEIDAVIGAKHDILDRFPAHGCAGDRIVMAKTAESIDNIVPRQVADIDPSIQRRPDRANADKFEQILLNDHRAAVLGQDAAAPMARRLARRGGKVIALDDGHAPFRVEAVGLDLQLEQIVRRAVGDGEIILVERQDIRIQRRIGKGQVPDDKPVTALKPQPAGNLGRQRCLGPQRDRPAGEAGHRIHVIGAVGDAGVDVLQGAGHDDVFQPQVGLGGAKDRAIAQDNVEINAVRDRLGGLDRGDKLCLIPGVEPVGGDLDRHGRSIIQCQHMGARHVALTGGGQAQQAAGNLEIPVAVAGGDRGAGDRHCPGPRPGERTKGDDRGGGVRNAENLKIDRHINLVHPVRDRGNQAIGQLGADRDRRQAGIIKGDGAVKGDRGRATDGQAHRIAHQTRVAVHLGDEHRRAFGVGGECQDRIGIAFRIDGHGRNPSLLRYVKLENWAAGSTACDGNIEIQGDGGN